MVSIEGKNKALFHKNLSSWADKYLRDFPWRSNPNPWNILVAEILLRRTTASQVNQVYPHIIELMPNPKEASKVNISTLSLHIKPIGLHSRSLILKKLGSLIVNKHNNAVPQNLEDLLSLPHVGDYTARAVRCFSFNIKEVVIDVNIVRVISRVFSLPVTPKLLNKPYNHKNFVQLMYALTPEKKPHLFYWTLLDIGGLLCNYKTQLCDECCLKCFCSQAKSQRKGVH